MKTILFFSCFLFILSNANAQLIISSGTSLKSNRGAYIVLNNIGLQHDGASESLDNVFKFTGNIDASIDGSTKPLFTSVEVAITGTAKIILQRSVNINQNLSFQSGLVDLNNNIIDLGTTGVLIGEDETSHIISPGGGYVQIVNTLNAPNNVNPGNLGAVITSSQNLGTSTIRRGHQSQTTGDGGGISVLRYFDIEPAINNSLNASLRFYYLDAELNSLDENSVTLWRSTNTTWSNEGFTSRNTSDNYVEKTGISSFSRWAPSSATEQVVQLSVITTGSGIITSNPTGINCGATCSRYFELGTSVTLMATPFTGYVFKNWTGGCSGSGPCTVMMDDDKTVWAIFEVDADGDHVGASVDCDDNNATVWQSGTLYIDVDGDGYDAGTATVCYGSSVPAGYSLISNGYDCNDNNAVVNSATVWYLDSDGDGYATSTTQSCTSPGANYTTTVLEIGDCNDGDSTVHLQKGFYTDNDHDGYGTGTVIQLCASTAPLGYADVNGDCDDNNAAIHPATTDTCNGLDDDCDGLIDEDCVTVTPGINIADKVVYETDGNLIIAVSLTKTFSENVQVTYSTLDGTAKSKAKGKNSPIDYQSKKGILTIPPGSLSGTIIVPIINDGLAEEDEYFTVQLSKPVNATIIDGSSIVTIKDGSPFTIIQTNTDKTTRNPNAFQEISGNKVDDILSVEIYPNPSVNEFILNVKSKSDEPFDLNIFDILGGKIQQIRATVKLVHFGNKLLPGIYAAVIWQGKKQITIKIQKQ